MKVRDLVELLTTKCKVYDLEQVRYSGMPAFQPVQPALLYFLYRHHKTLYNPETDGPRSSASGLIIMSDQSGTHIDARCHQASDLTLIGGIKVTGEIETPWGFTKLGADEISPLIARGVLVDVARVHADPLPEDGDVSLDQFKRALDAQNVTIRPGDVVLMRTGYGRYWNDPPKYAKAPGASKELTLWLAEQNPMAVGADNVAWDNPHYVDPDTRSRLVAHLYLLAKRGIYIIENLYLEEISRERVNEFLFIGLPLKFKGATGSPLRPIAIVPHV
ncbi:MAG: cyclase family protein [Aigarchaeota archaeon]|nr:cyclase family protein [Aigarchaeota archaeon]MDW8092224.1 cyclase family protein [Nitrososphaerota archaeon]